MIKGILFDKDGTLIEFERMWYSIMSLVYTWIEEGGNLDQMTLMQLKNISGYGTHGFEPESMIQYLPTSGIVSAWADEVTAAGYHRQTYHNYFHRLFELAAVDEAVEVAQIDGVEATLSYLRDKSYYLGIATADTEASMQHSLRKAGLGDMFHFYGSDNGFHEGKPDPHMALDFCQKMGITSDELLIVGDSVNDMVFAKNAKASFVGIINSYGTFTGQDSLDVPMIRNFRELIEVMAL